MWSFKEFAESKKCPPGFKYDKKLKVCVPIIKKYAYYGRMGPGPKQEPQNTSGNGNANAMRETLVCVNMTSDVGAGDDSDLGA